MHDALCQEPHPSGSEAERRLIARLADLLSEFGLEVERQDLWPYQPQLERVEVEVLAGRKHLRLPVREAALAEDRYSAHPLLQPGWNAYSGSGQVTAPVVYANYASGEDFATLTRLGVEVKGKVVIARYGGAFRGFKARHAEEAGAAGVILYTDPDDSGYRHGVPYPEGGWANASSIQRGALLTLPYPGDPLTPGVPATRGAARLDPAAVPFPRIPVQPIGWGAASEILSRMRGPAVPHGWQGGLPFAYRLEGGPDLRVRLRVEQTRALTPTANVLGVLRGSTHPEQLVIVGCHFDAWTFGAGDPHAGSIVLLEMARSFAAAARSGQGPARTVVFANWAAEELGTIGSVEWCEAHREELERNGVAYLNLDMAAMGPDFGSSAAPLLRPLITAAARIVRQAREDNGESAWAGWARRTGEAPRFGDLGGGSDHVGFYYHAGVPACALGAGGSSGVSYHSAYDTLPWYRKVVGDDYEPALMLTRIANLVVARLANATVLPFDPTQYAPDLRDHLAALATRAKELGYQPHLEPLLARVDAFEPHAVEVLRRIQAAIREDRLAPEAVDRVNRALIDLERCWLRPEGLPGRPWFRSLYAASDPGSGYAAWMLPLLRAAVEARDPVLEREAIDAYLEVLDRLEARLGEIEHALTPPE